MPKKAPLHWSLFAARQAAASTPRDGDELVEQALDVLSRRLASRSAKAMTTPADLADFLRLSIADRAAECFVSVALDAQHRVLAIDELFRGTIDGTSVHPRIVVQTALQRNAAAIVVAHNHPSGVAEPSQADIRITERLRAALALVDVRLLDHFVIGAGDATSLAERGLI